MVSAWFCTVCSDFYLTFFKYFNYTIYSALEIVELADRNSATEPVHVLLPTDSAVIHANNKTINDIAHRNASMSTANAYSEWIICICSIFSLI
jgi:hypothetical protein